jgi:hypothetical protein
VPGSRGFLSGEHGGYRFYTFAQTGFVQFCIRFSTGRFFDALLPADFPGNLLGTPHFHHCDSFVSAVCDPVGPTAGFTEDFARLPLALTDRELRFALRLEDTVHCRFSLIGGLAIGMSVCHVKGSLFRLKIADAGYE